MVAFPQPLNLGVLLNTFIAATNMSIFIHRIILVNTSQQLIQIPPIGGTFLSGCAHPSRHVYTKKKKHWWTSHYHQTFQRAFSLPTKTYVTPYLSHSLGFYLKLCQFVCPTELALVCHGERPRSPGRNFTVSQTSVWVLPMPNLAPWVLGYVGTISIRFCASLQILRMMML